MCGLTLKAVGNASPPSAICALGQSLIFIGSWLGHSNVVSYTFEDPEVVAKAEREKAEKEREKAVAEQAAAAAAADAAGAAEETPKAVVLQADKLEEAAAAADTDTQAAGDPTPAGHAATATAAAAAAATATATVVAPTATDPADSAGTAVAADASLISSPASAMSTEPPAVADGASVLDVLVEKLKSEPSDAAIEAAAAEVAVPAATEQSTPQPLVGAKPAPEPQPQPDQAEAAAADAAATPVERPKRSFGSMEGAADDNDNDKSPAVKIPKITRVDVALSGVVLAIEATSPQATARTPSSSPAAALPFGPRGGTLVPGLGRGAVPGLGLIGAAPAVAREESEAITEVPDAPLEEENPSASSDDDNLEASLYQCAAALVCVKIR